MNATSGSRCRRAARRRSRSPRAARAPRRWRSRPAAARAAAPDTTLALSLSLRRFARPQTIGCDDRLYASTVAPDGRALVVCKHKRLETWEGRARLRRTARLPTGSVSGEDSVRIDLAAGGSALVTWSRAVPARFARARVMAALRSGRGAFGAPAAITDDFDSVQPVAARLVGDGAMVIAETFGAGRSMLAIRYR